MRKRILILVLGLTLSLSTLVSAAVTYPYGINKYGEKNLIFMGNLAASGLGVDWRPANVNRHDLRFKNVNTGKYTPDKGYLQTVQYDIQPLPNESENKFSKKSGYHVAPLDEELVRDIAKRANGNPDYVWQQVSEHAKKAASSPSRTSDKVKLYRIENTFSYVDIGSIIYYSGGGDPEMLEAGGNGITSPVFQTTYKTTNWPEIVELKQDGQKLKIKASGHSVYDALVSGQIIVNNDATTTKKVFTKNTPVSNYTVTYEGSIPLSELPGLKAGDNKVTLRVNDAFGRTTEKEVIVNTVEERPNLQVVNITVEPSKLEQGGKGTATVTVRNDSKQKQTSPVVFKVEGKTVGNQMVTLEPGQEKALTFDFSVPEKNTVHLQATINPNKDQPKGESTYNDNTKDITVPAIAKVLEKPPGDKPEEFDLQVEIPGEQSDLRWGKKTPVYVMVKNGGFYNEHYLEYPVSSNTKITVSYPGYSDSFTRELETVKPGQLLKFEVPTPDYKAFSTKYGTPIPESGYLDINVTAHVNYDERTTEERVKTNNTASGVVRVFWSKTKIIDDKK